MGPVVKATGLSVGRGTTAILRDVNLAVAKGERVALVGGNGSGKTTLLRALAGLDRPHAGGLAWLGNRLPTRAARVRVVSVVFQSGPAGPFNVRDLVTLGLGLDRPPNDEERARVIATIARLRIGDLADRAAATLSGGEAQRAALARALVAGPALLLLDEPTNHLDPAGRAQLLRLLDELRGSVSVVLATHDLDLATTADRIALLGSGGVLALGVPSEVLTPALLGRALGVEIRRVSDPAGGRPFLRVEGNA